METKQTKETKGTKGTKETTTNKSQSRYSNNQNAAKPTRRVLLGWLHYNNNTATYASVNSKQGGVLRAVNVQKNTTLKEMTQIAKDIYFPNGLSKVGRIEDMKTCLFNFERKEECDEDDDDAVNEENIPNDDDDYAITEENIPDGDSMTEENEEELSSRSHMFLKGIKCSNDLNQKRCPFQAKPVQTSPVQTKRKCTKDEAVFLVKKKTRISKKKTHTLMGPYQSRSIPKSCSGPVPKLYISTDEVSDKKTHTLTGPYQSRSIPKSHSRPIPKMDKSTDEVSDETTHTLTRPYQSCSKPVPKSRSRPVPKMDKSTDGSTTKFQLSQIYSLGKSMVSQYPTTVKWCQVQYILDTDRGPKWESLPPIKLFNEIRDPMIGGMRQEQVAKTIPTLPFGSAKSSRVVVKTHLPELVEMWKAVYPDNTSRHMAKRECQVQHATLLLMKEFMRLYKDVLGCKLSVLESFLLTDAEGNMYTVEPYLEGNFRKYNSNDGWETTPTSHLGRVVLAFSHWTYEASAEKLMVLDAQGVGNFLTDPEVVNVDHSESSITFGIGNMGEIAIKTYRNNHKCSEICRRIGLTEFKHEGK